MGLPMCANIIKAGHQVVVNDLREEATERLIELGAEWADTPADVARRSEVLMTSLPTPNDVERVLSGADGILEGAAPGTAYFDLSTNFPATVRRLVDVAAARGVVMLDCAVSGGTKGAEEATLAVMVGGDRATFNRYEPLLKTIGPHVFYMGAAGNGALVKLINNLVSIGSGLLLHEAVVLAEKTGIDPQRAYEVMNVASASRYVQQMPHLLERDFGSPTFALGLAAKDLRLAVQAGHEAGMAMPIASAACEHLLRAVAHGLGGMEIGAALLPAEAAAGIAAQPSAAASPPPAHE
jgi:3-hydroxyisobutyrate dehydrogenase